MRVGEKRVVSNLRGMTTDIVITKNGAKVHFFHLVMKIFS